MPPEQARVAVIIPIFNESESLPELLAWCDEVLQDPRVELILVDNGSTDESWPILTGFAQSRPACRAVRIRTNAGLGGAIETGIRLAMTHYVAWMPGNLKVHPRAILEGMDRIEGASAPDATAAKALRRGRPLGERVPTALLALLWSALTRRWLWDAGAPPTIVPRSLVASRALPAGFEIEAHALWLIRSAKLRLIRFPVPYTSRRHGLSRWNTGLRARLGLAGHITGFLLSQARRGHEPRRNRA